MKQFLLLFLFILVFNTTTSAQIASGDKLSANIATKDINGNDVDIFADLAAGKTVVLDIFATWCGPCWSFHQTHMLEELHQEFGPDGTDQIRVYAIEGDNTTPLSDISQASSTSIGNWLDGISYSVVNNHNFNTILKIEAFPTLYVIRPDKSVFNIFGYHFNKAVWEKALLPTNEKELFMVTGLSDRTFCNSLVFNQRPKFINMGTTAISSIDATLSLNGEETIATFSNPLSTFEEVQLSFGNKTLKENTEIEIVIDDIDDKAFEVSGFGALTASFLRNVAKKPNLTIKFTTDFYPVETSFTVKDGNKTLLTHKFEGPDNGGGEDANKTFEFPITVDQANSGCLVISVSDAFGDGLTTFSTTDEVPGVEIIDENGVIVKRKLVSDYDFTTARSIATVTDFTSSLSDEEFVENLNVFPNPVNDILNINMTIKADTEYEVFVTDIMGASVTNINKNTNFLNVSNLTSGMYFLNVRTKNGIFTHKFTKI